MRFEVYTTSRFSTIVPGQGFKAGVPDLNLTMYPFSISTDKHEPFSILTDEHVPLKVLMTKYSVMIIRRYF